MKHKIWALLAMAALLSAPLVMAGQNEWFWKVFEDQVLSSGNRAHMARTGTGVTLIGVIDNYQNRSERVYSLQPGAWYMIAGDAAGNAAESTGSTSDSAVTIEYRYGISNKIITRDQWEAKGEGGTTLIAVWTISGISDPVEFDPEPARFVGIFAAPPGGPTQFCVPQKTWLAWQ